jgi:hypothetical protein
VQTPSAPTTRQSQAPKPDLSRGETTSGDPRSGNANLTAEHVGEIFSSDPRALTSLPGFLAAYPLSRQMQWSLADIFNFLAEADPQHIVSWVPRLFPLPGAPTWPARMLFATSVEIGIDPA